MYLADRRPTGSVFGYTADLAAALMSVLGTNRVDVVALNDAPPLLDHRVLRDGQRILSRNLRATATREGYALSRYCDYVPQLAKIEADLIWLKPYAGGPQDAWDITQLLEAGDAVTLVADVEGRLGELPPDARQLWTRLRNV